MHVPSLIRHTTLSASAGKFHSHETLHDSPSQSDIKTYHPHHDNDRLRAADCPLSHQFLPVLYALQELLVPSLRVGALQPGLDAAVLLVEVVHVWHQVLDDVHVWQRVYLGRL